MNRVKTIGIVGGGQLGMILTEAAIELGFKVVVVNPTANSPAAQAGAQEIVADLYDKAALRELAKRTDVITVEIEHLDTNALEKIAQTDTPVHPSPATIRLIQDKYQQKVFLQKSGIPVAPFRIVESNQEAHDALSEYGGKMILKTRHGAYDGRGNATINSEDDLEKSLEHFKDSKLYAEEQIPFAKELAVIIARGTSGAVKIYPVVETFHVRNICSEVHSPAVIDKSIYEKAIKVAEEVAKHLVGAGVFAIEMFLTQEGEVLVNEIAPRVHNSGHHTIEGNETSQFEQHIRAVTGMKLGPTDIKVQAAVMINILGERNGETKISGLEIAEQIPDVYVHLYGKSPTKIDRKMGHITATGKDMDETIHRARQARKAIQI